MALSNDRWQGLAHAFPKVELHRHFEGSVRLSTLVEIALENNLDMNNAAALRPLVQMMPDDPRTAACFLSKFGTLRHFFRSPEWVARITREIVEDAADDHVRYMELRLTPKALCAFSGVPMSAMVETVCSVGNMTAAELGITIRYLISVNRHETVALAEEALDAGLAHQHLGIVGLDLAGNEADYSALPFADMFARGGANDLKLTIHAGEWGNASNITEAVNVLHASRIGHGVAAIHDARVIETLIANDVALEICPTSNVLSGIVPDFGDHPIYHLHQLGVTTTLNTDDPAVCDVTLSDEFALMMRHFGLSLADACNYTIQAARSSFLPEHEKAALIAELTAQFATIEDVE